MTVCEHKQIVMCTKRHYLHMMKGSCIKTRQNAYMTLTPGRYVGIEDEEDDGIPFEEKMERLASELGELLRMSADLDEKICQNLKQLGYDVS
jgi:type I restriction enzyme M protein